MKTRGMTLIETLISAVILIVVGLAMLILFQSTMKEYRFKSQLSATLKSNSAGLNQMAKEIMTATTLYYPGTATAWDDLNSDSDNIEVGYQPTCSGTSIAFYVDGEVVGYYLDGQTGKINRINFNTNQTTTIAYVEPRERFQYDKFTFKFDRDYKNVSGHSPNPPDNDYKQVLVIGIVVNRPVSGGTIGYYPMTTKIWLERNEHFEVNPYY